MIAEMKTCENCRRQEQCGEDGIGDVSCMGWQCLQWEPPVAGQDKMLGAFGPCVKCGCESILMQYSDGKTQRVGEIFHVPAMECEHQDCRCGQCGYTWEQVCVDAAVKADGA